MSILANRMREIFGDHIEPLLIAHRGNRALCPENTLASFRQAVQNGADMLETDLHLTADGVLVCIHDGSVDRTTNGSGEVASLTLKEIKSLKTLDSKGNPTDETIPTLAELAAFLPPHIALALELKTDRFLEADICRQLGEELKSYGIFERIIALSFSLARLQVLKDAYPEISIGWITMSRFIPDADVEMIGPFWPLLYLNPFYVAMAHRRGLFVCPLDPSPEARLGYYLRQGCDALISDNPAKTKAALTKRSDQDQALS